MAAFKQIEVDQRIELDDQHVLSILDKMIKQRKDSITQFKQAGRTELADKEQYEIGIISTYLPQQLTESEINQLVKDAIDQLNATEMKHMGQVMAILKPQLQGRADLGQVSQTIKALLSA